MISSRDAQDKGYQGRGEMVSRTGHQEGEHDVRPAGHRADSIDNLIKSEGLSAP